MYYTDLNTINTPFKDYGFLIVLECQNSAWRMVYFIPTSKYYIYANFYNTYGGAGWNGWTDNLFSRNVQQSLTSLQNTFNSVIANLTMIVPYIINNVSIQSGETDVRINIPAIDNYRPAGIVGVDYGDLRHVYLTQFNLHQAGNYTGFVLIGLYSSKAVTEDITLNILFIRRGSVNFSNVVTQSYMIEDNK